MTNSGRSRITLPAKYAGGPTVTDLANRYLEEHVAVRCKPKTQRTARSIVNRHIVPALGKLPIAAVERRHVMALHESLCETPAMANMTVETLSHMYALARGWDMAPEGYAADWTIGQLRDPAQRIADRIEALMMNDHAPAAETP